MHCIVTQRPTTEKVNAAALTARTPCGLISDCTDIVHWMRVTSVLHIGLNVVQTSMTPHLECGVVPVVVLPHTVLRMSTDSRRRTVT